MHRNMHAISSHIDTKNGEEEEGKKYTTNFLQSHTFALQAQKRIEYSIYTTFIVA